LTPDALITYLTPDCTTSIVSITSRMRSYPSQNVLMCVPIVPSWLDLYTQPQNSLKGGYRIVLDNPSTQEVTHMPRVTYLQRSVFME